MAQPFSQNAGADRAAVAAILLFHLLAVLLSNGLYDTPIYDDWAYGKAVKTLLDEGRLHFTWTATSLIFQVMVGALFCLPFGFSFSALHLSTLAFSICGILALYGWLRSVGRGPLASLLVALVTASSLFYFHFIFTFMNDVPALALCFVALWVAARAETTNRPTTWLWAAAAMLAAAMTRDFTLLLVFGFVISWLAIGRRRGPHLWLLAAFPFFGAYLVFQRLAITMPHRYAKVSPDFFTVETLLLFFKVICYMGIFFLPLLAAQLPAALGKDGFLRRRGMATALLILLVLLSILAVWQYNQPEGGEDRLMPYRPGFISLYGTYNAAPLPGDRPVLMGTGFRLALTAASILGAALLLLAAGVLLARFVTRMATDRRMARLTTLSVLILAAAALLMAVLPRVITLDRVQTMFAIVGWKVSLTVAVAMALLRFLARFQAPRDSNFDVGTEPPGFRTAVPAYLLALGMLVYFLITGKFFIRYALLLVPGVVLLPLDAFRHTRLNRAILAVGLAATFALGVVWTRDQASFNEARWAAGNWLLEQGVPVDRIEGGFEWNCWHLEFGGERPSPRHQKSPHGNNKIWLIPNNLLTLDTFANVTTPDPATPDRRVWKNRIYRPINSFGYTSILLGRDREVQVWKAVGPAPTTD
jgi:hypothetical protein